MIMSRFYVFQFKKQILGPKKRGGTNITAGAHISKNAAYEMSQMVFSILVPFQLHS